VPAYRAHCSLNKMFLTYGCSSALQTLVAPALCVCAALHRLACYFESNCLLSLAGLRLGVHVTSAGNGFHLPYVSAAMVLGGESWNFLSD
jgi:hypothetical protein